MVRHYSLSRGNPQRAGPFAEQMDLGEGWSHVVGGGRFVKITTTPPPNPKPSPQPVTEVPMQSEVTPTWKTVGPKKIKPKSTAATKPAAGKPGKKAAASVKTVAAKPTTLDLVVPSHFPPLHSRTYLISSIASPSKHVWS